MRDNAVRQSLITDPLCTRYHEGMSNSMSNVENSGAPSPVEVAPDKAGNPLILTLDIGTS